MAEFLVKVSSNTNPDPEKDRRGCYKRGYVVSVVRDGHVWGLEESKQAWIAAGRDPALWPNHFYIIRVPTVTYEQVMALATSQVCDDAGVPLVDENGIPIIFRRREYYLNIDTLKASIKTALETNGEVTVTVQDIRNDVKRIRDNASFPGL